MLNIFAAIRPRYELVAKAFSIKILTYIFVESSLVVWQSTREWISKEYHQEYSDVQVHLNMANEIWLTFKINDISLMSKEVTDGHSGDIFGVD